MNTRQLFTSALLATSLLLATPALAQNEAEAAEAPQLNFRTSDDFSLALGHLEGATDNLSILNVQRRIESWTQMFEEVFQSDFAQQAFEENEVPQELREFDFNEVLELIGIHNLTTYALGVEETDSGWLQRSFLGIDGQAKGLAALGGTENSPWQATQIARKDDDLILELSLDAGHLGRWLVETTQFINKSMPAEVQQALAEEGMVDVDPMAMAFLDPSTLTEPMLPNGQSILELLTEIGQPRISLILNLPPSEDLPELIFDMGEQENPMLFLEAGGSLTIAIDRFEAILKLLEPMFAEQGFETTEENGLKITRFLDEETTEMMGFPEEMLAQLSYNPKTTSALIELGKPSPQAAGSITESADFTAATQSLPKEGSSLAWISKDTIGAVYTFFEILARESGEEEAEAIIELAMPFLSQFYGLPPADADRGLAGAGFWVEGGYLEVYSSPVPPMDSSIFGIYTLSVLSAIAVPAVEAVMENAHAAEDSSNARNLVTALIAYCIEEGEYPETLEALFTEGILDEGGRELLFLESDWDWKWSYRQVEADAPAGSIILWAQINEDEYLFATVSGGVVKMSEAEFRQLAAAQGIEMEEEEADFGQFF